MDRPPLAEPLLEHHDQIVELCRRYGVERLEVFGSAADGRFDPARSDFDFIVRLGRGLGADQGSLGRRFVGLAEALEALLGRSVDLMPDKPIRNPYFHRAVEASRQVLYDRSAAEAPA